MVTSFGEMCFSQWDILSLEVGELGPDRHCLGRAPVGLCDREFAAEELCGLGSSWILMLLLIFSRLGFAPG